MSHVDRSTPQFSASDESDLGEYSALSTLAIVALAVGLASALALANVFLWFVPLIGVLTALAALGRIQRSAGALSGRGLALAGLLLSVLFGSAAVGQFYSVQFSYTARAQRIALQWFAALAEGQPQVAQQIGMAAQSRARVSDPEQLWTYYRNTPESRSALERYAAEPVIRTLLELGTRAQVQLYATDRVTTVDARSVVEQTYAVTYDDNGQKKTFFLHLTLERSVQSGSGRVDWRLVSYSPGPASG